MNVLVTGGAGYIGSACVEALLEAGHTVTVFDNLSEGHRSAVTPGASLRVGDLADAAAVQQAMKESQAEVIIHFAANALVGESMANPSKYFRNNVCAGLNLLDAAVAYRARKIIFSSTCATYGHPEQLPITEETPQRPINPYGESKLMFEKMLRWHQTIHGLDFVAFRYFNAAGATPKLGEHHRIETHLIPNVLRVALGQAEYCQIFGTDYPTPDGTCVRDYIHILDLARAHILAMVPGSTGFFNLGNGDGCSVRAVIRACEEVAGKQIAVREGPRREGDPPRLVASAERARRELGWEPRFPRLEQMVASAWEWHRRHPLGYKD